MLRLFFRFELEKVRKYFRTRALAKVVTTLMFFAVFLFVGAGIYFFFVSGFRSINREAVPDSKMALALFLYEVFLLILAAITAFSATVSGVFNLFKGANNTWLIGSPRFATFPKIVLLRSVMTSALPFLVLFVPATLAFNKVYGLGMLSLVSIVLSILFLLVTINSLTLSFLLAVTLLYYKLTQKISKLRFSFGGLISILIAGVSLALISAWGALRGLDLVQLFKADIESDVLSVENIAGYFHFLPTHPFATELLNWQNANYTSALSDLIVLLVVMLSSFIVWWVFSPHFYRPWQKFQEGATLGSSVLGVVTPSHKRVYLFSGSQTMALFKKEMLVNSRNYKGIFWFLFLFVIWLLQIGTNSVLGFNIAKHQSDISLKLALLQSLQFVIAIYFISSFSLRFVFPSFSVEKKSAWILASAPLRFRDIFYGKYLFYATFFVIIGLIMSGLTTYALNVPVLHTLYSVVLFITATLFIVTFGLSFGAMFPSKESDDPEVVTTSMPGLFFTALSLLFGALCAFVLYLTLYYGFFPLLFTLVTLIILGIVILLSKTPLFVKRVF